MSPTQTQKPVSTVEKLTQQDIAWMKDSIKQRVFWSNVALVVAIFCLIATVFYHASLLFLALFAFGLRYMTRRGIGQITRALASGTKYVGRFKCKTKWVHKKQPGSKVDSTRYYLKTDDDRDVQLGGAFSGNGGVSLYDQLQENDVLVVSSVDDRILFWIDAKLEKSDSTR